MNKSSDMAVSMVFEWYWRNDDEEGFVEDYTLSIQDGDDDTSDDQEEGECVSGVGGGITYVNVLEGSRSQLGQGRMKLCVEALAQLEDQVLQTGVSLVSIMRFVVLCTRMESRKCQGRAGSVTVLLLCYGFRTRTWMGCRLLVAIPYS